MSSDEERAVMQALQGFYDALAEIFVGNPEPMKQVWSHADDVAYLGPSGGLLIGWEQVFGDLSAQAELKLGGTVRPEDIHVTLGRDIAVVHNYEIGDNVDPAGKAQTVSLRTTNLFRKEAGSWKMIGHQTDLLPFLVEAMGGGK
jgi:ketosteroid isomerase-like protein